MGFDKLFSAVKKMLKEEMTDLVEEKIEEKIEEKMQGDMFFQPDELSRSDWSRRVAATSQTAVKPQNVLSREELKQRIQRCLDSIEGITYQCDVAAGEIDASAHPAAKPVDFIVYKNGAAYLAIVVVALNTYKSMPVKGTQMLVEKRNMKYMRFFVEKENETSYISQRIIDNL